jgi:SAM-dependent methyltransferase
MNPWDKDYRQGGYRTWPCESLISWVCTHFKTGAGLRALDLGCGAGANAWFLAHHGFDAVGVDSSKEAIKAAKCLREEWDSTFKIANRDIIADGLYGLGFFDLICDVTCLQHLTEQSHAKALAEIYRHLKPGGFLFSYRLSDKTNYKDIFPNEPPAWLASEEQIGKQLESSGFINLRGLWLDREYPGHKRASYLVIEAQKEGTPCEVPSSSERSSLLFW